MQLTIFTPTYNRAEKLNRVYESLKKQTCFDFEWLIVDDGSNDNTSEVVSEFLKNDFFPVQYIKQNNGGKHRAYNRGLKEANGNYFFCLDSDDFLDNDAVKDILELADGKNGVISYKIDEKGNLLSNEISNLNCCMNFQELQSSFGSIGEVSIAFPTKIAKKYTFPEFDGEKFVTEAVVYDRLDLELKYHILPRVTTICEYQEDGLSNNLNKIMKANPASYCLYFMQRIDMQQKLKNKIIVAGKYNCFRIFAGSKRTEYDGNYKNIVILSKPIGVLFYIYYKIFRGF
jgi:glycosyltransferase involved in cell wall biosynthesis